MAGGQALVTAGW